MEGYFYLGKILKPFAAKGALLINLDVDSPEDYEDMESVFVQMNGQLIPFLIESFELKHNNRAVITFPDIDTIDQASILSGCELYLPVEMLKPLSGNRFYYHEVPGYEVYDKVHGFVGIITEVLEYPHQAVLSILFKGKEILIPVTDEIVIGIDREKKSILTNAPEGLIELYLED
ncbi:MAG: ribosome maturation factor RimM [Omnitrophica WOR_2 bacterium]|jgi:16S rRNA processing protein RimM